MYKTTNFERREIEDIKLDIEMAKDLYGERVRTVFIGDSNSLVLNPESMIEILNPFMLFSSYRASDQLCQGKDTGKEAD